MTCFLILLWQLETFKRTLMQSLQEDDENPSVSRSSFAAQSLQSLFASCLLKLIIALVVFRVRVVRSGELQIPTWQSEKHHVSCFVANPGSNSLVSKIP